MMTNLGEQQIPPLRKISVALNIRHCQISKSQNFLSSRPSGFSAAPILFVIANTTNDQKCDGESNSSAPQSNLEALVIRQRCHAAPIASPEPFVADVSGFLIIFDHLLCLPSQNWCCWVAGRPRSPRAEKILRFRDRSDNVTLVS